MATPDLEQLRAMGYADIRMLNGKCCAIAKFAFTTAIMVGISDWGYERRYCYEHHDDAAAALAQWDGCEHPGGPWIKCKGLGIDLLNPNLKCEF